MFTVCPEMDGLPVPHADKMFKKDVDRVTLLLVGVPAGEHCGPRGLHTSFLSGLGTLQG